MNKYELLFVLPGTLDDKEVEASSEQVLNVVKENGGDVELHPMGKNRLAYPIKQIRYGYFYTATFKAEPNQVTALHNKLRLMREVLRFIISHFNTNLTTAQKIAYSTDASGITTMVEKERPAIVSAEPLLEEKSAATLKSAVARPVDPVNIEEINKKLDDLMSGDVIPGI